MHRLVACTSSLKSCDTGCVAKKTSATVRKHRREISFVNCKNASLVACTSCTFFSQPICIRRRIVLRQGQLRDACITTRYESVFQFIRHDGGAHSGFVIALKNPARVSRLSRPWSEFDSLCRRYRWRDELRTTWSSHDPRENWKRESKKALQISRTTIKSSIILKSYPFINLHLCLSFYIF